MFARIGRFPLACFAALSLLPGWLVAQRLELPHGTGGIVPTATWNALHGEALAATSRPDDPAAEPGRSQLLARLGELQIRQRTAEHVVLHSPGATTGGLRLVECYSDAVMARTAELLQPATVERIRDGFVTEYGKGGVPLAFVGHDDPKLFPTGSLRLRFELGTGEQRRMLQHHTVPAGERVQYFEASYAADDAEAAAAIDALLRTFDGAREQPGGLLSNMLLGGLAGGAAGCLMAVWRRRRLQRMAGSATTPR